MDFETFFYDRAKPSKLTAKIIIAVIWFLAGSLATPMAIARRVVMEPEGSTGKFHQRSIHILSQNWIFKNSLSLSRRSRSLQTVLQRGESVRSIDVNLLRFIGLPAIFYAPFNHFLRLYESGVEIVGKQSARKCRRFPRREFIEEQNEGR